MQKRKSRFQGGWQSADIEQTIKRKTHQARVKTKEFDIDENNEQRKPPTKMLVHRARRTTLISTYQVWMF